MVDIRPEGVLNPGSSSDYRYYNNPVHWQDSNTGWIRFWAPWFIFQHVNGEDVGQGANNNYTEYGVTTYVRPKINALDAQIAQAKSDGLKVMLVSWGYPQWANGTAHLGLPSNLNESDVNFMPWNRMSYSTWLSSRSNRGVLQDHNWKSLFYKCPDDRTPTGPWGRWIEWLYHRYGDATHNSAGAKIDALEIINEPNGYQYWPQQSEPPSDSSFQEKFSYQMSRIVHCHVAEMMQTADTIADWYGRTIRLAAPAASDSPNQSRLLTSRHNLTEGILDLLANTNFSGRDTFAWTQHNYWDIEVPDPNYVRALQTAQQLTGRWTGAGGSTAPKVWLTEGGFRLQKGGQTYTEQQQHDAVLNAYLRVMYPGTPIRMWTNYGMYTDPNYDSGLVNQDGSRRLVYGAFSTFSSD